MSLADTSIIKVNENSSRVNLMENINRSSQKSMLNYHEQHVNDHSNVNIQENKLSTSSNNNFSNDNNNNNGSSMNSITYKSVYFTPLTFILLTFTLLPIQYHNENFSIQMRKMLDTCAESFGYFNQNQTNILDIIFPYGFSSSLSFENLINELKVIDEIHQKQVINNLTVKYLSQNECLANNYSNILNIITISSTSTLTSQPVDKRNKYRINRDIVDDYKMYQDEDESEDDDEDLVGPTYQKFRIKQQPFYRSPTTTNLILICDDESYKKSVLNELKQNKGEKTFSNDNDINIVSNTDLIDFQSNILTQVKYAIL